MPEKPYTIENCKNVCCETPCCKCEGETVRICKKYKYIPPERTKDFKPERCWKPPEAPMQQFTVYNGSYQNYPVETFTIQRQKPILPKVRIQDRSGSLSDVTTHRHDYRKWPCAQKTVPIVPCYSTGLLGTGPVQSETTMKHDYTPKPYSRMQPIVPPPAVSPKEGGMAGTTTMKESYKEPGAFEPTVSFKPKLCITKAAEAIDSNTVHKMSYPRWALSPKPQMPWIPSKEYRQPDSNMECHTIYNTSYLPAAGERPCLLVAKDTPNLLGNNSDFQSNTIYKSSYIPNEITEVVKPILPGKGSFKSPEGRFSGETTYVHDYRKWCGKHAAKQIVPCGESLGQSGPMQNMTTNRHDYTPKPYSKLMPIFPDPSNLIMKGSMEGVTTMSESYKGFTRDMVDQTKSFKPPQQLQKSDLPMDDKTIHKLSFLPWDVNMRTTEHVKKKSDYQPPTDKLEGNTVYNTSYLPPGRYECVEEVECTMLPQGPCECCDCQ